MILWTYMITTLLCLKKDALFVPYFSAGETIVILQRNAQTNEDRTGKHHGYCGSVDDGQTKASHRFATKVFDSLPLSSKDLATLDILVVAANPWVGRNNMSHPQSQRSMETADAVLAAAREFIDHHSHMSSSQLLNTSATPDGGVVPISDIFFSAPEADWPELGEFYRDNITDTEEAVFDFTEDKLESTRARLHIEGPYDLQRRLEQFMSFTRAGRNYHFHHHSRRLLLWAVNHFDVANPYLNEILLHPAVLEPFIYVEHLGGLTFHIDKEGNQTVYVGKNRHEVKYKHQFVTG